MREEYPKHAAGELRQHVENGVPTVNAAEKEIGESKGRIEVCAGSTPKGRTNDTVVLLPARESSHR